MISAAFIVTCVAIVVAPGPSFAVMVNQTLRHGRPAGLATVAGNTTALTCWAAASALGLTALIRTSEIAFLALKIAGAAYLCWLGIQTLLRTRATKPAAASFGVESPTADATPEPGTQESGAPEPGAPEPGALESGAAESGAAAGTGAAPAPGAAADDRPKSLFAAFRAGLLTNLTNPKAAVLYLALFPQFLPAHGGFANVATLAITQMTISASWYVLVVLAVAGIRRLLSQPTVKLWLDRITSCVLIGLGVRLAALARP